MLGSMLEEFQRMNKRQVFRYDLAIFYIHSIHLMYLFVYLVFLPSFELWHDCLICPHDLERVDGCYWK